MHYNSTIVGRKPVSKERREDPQQKEAWARVLLPIYIKNGLQKFSMDEVAKQLSISKATLYKHFKSREEIIETALIVKLNDIGSFKEMLFDESQPYLDRYFNSIHLFFAEISGISNEFLLDLKKLYPEIWKRVEFFREYAATMLKAFYQKGIEIGVFNDVDPTILVLNDKMFFDAISDPEFLIQNGLSLQKAFRDYFTLRTQGLFKDNVPELGRKIDDFIGGVTISKE
ncbi:TetR/AcrR family transcriptional regulator [soil metagenome]